MTSARPLDTKTLDSAAQDLVGQWFLPTRYSRFDKSRPIMGRGWVIDSLYNATFKDEHLYLIERMVHLFGQDALSEFKKAAADRFTPRDDTVFEQLLADKLAINPAGEHIPGKIGTTNLGARVVDRKPKVIRLRNGRQIALVKPVYWPVYAGEAEERIAESGVADPLPETAEPLSLGAEVTNISAEIAILGLDAALDGLDEGTGAAVLQGRTGAQPADPDAAVSGTLLFTLVYSDPAFLGAADQADGTVQAAADTVTDDPSADATGTLSYCRLSATNDGATPLDDHIDGNAGVTDEAFVFNTVNIVAGATISLTGHTVTWSQGSTAT